MKQKVIKWFIVLSAGTARHNQVARSLADSHSEKKNMIRWFILRALTCRTLRKVQLLSAWMEHGTALKPPPAVQPVQPSGITDIRLSPCRPFNSFNLFGRSSRSDLGTHKECPDQQTRCRFRLNSQRLIRRLSPGKSGHKKGWERFALPAFFV